MSKEKQVVILAEDDLEIKEIYTKAMVEAGIEVHHVSNGKELFGLLEEGNVEADLILLDIIMPEMNGFEALKKLKEDAKYNHIPVMITSNLDSEEDQLQAKNLGAQEYVVKSHRTPFWLVEEVKKYRV